MKKISILSPCYNEEKNIPILYNEVKEIMAKLPNYEYEHIFADNDSTDNSAEVLRKLAHEDKNVKVIINNGNFGADRSSINLFYSSSGDAVISMASDLQDPIELIPELVSLWEKGNKVVWLQRKKTSKGFIDHCRNIYYFLIKRMSNSQQYDRCTGSGLYDREVVDWLKWMDNPDALFRNEVPALGYKPYLIEFEQKKRINGKSSYNFFSYFSTAILSAVSTSKTPLRLTTFFGMFIAFIGFIISLIYLVYKLLFWNSFNAGTAPLIIGLFFLGGVQLITIGVVGEYVGAVLNKVKKQPIVVEKERINFDSQDKRK